MKPAVRYRCQNHCTLCQSLCLQRFLHPRYPNGKAALNLNRFLFRRGACQGTAWACSDLRMRQSGMQERYHSSQAPLRPSGCSHTVTIFVCPSEVLVAHNYTAIAWVLYFTFLKMHGLSGCYVAFGEP